MIRNHRTLLTWISLMALAGCSTAPTTRSQAPAPSPKNAAALKKSRPAGTQAQEREYQEIHDLYAKGDYEAAIERLDLFMTSNVKSPLMSQAENLTGLCYLLSKRPAQAIPHFKMAIQSNPKAHGFNQYVLYNQAKAELEAGQIEEASETLNKIDSQAYDTENRVKFHYLKSQLFQRKSLPYESAREVLLASRIMDSLQIREARTSFQQTLDAALQQIGGIASLEDLYREFEDSPLADVVLFRLASREQLKGNLANAEIHLQTLMTRYPQSDFYAQARTLSQGKESEGSVDSSAVGIILPLKGKFAKFGMRSLQGIELAFRIFDSGSKDSKITLVLEDSGDEPEQAVRALNRLVNRHHVVAVIGPLMAKGIDAVTRRAQELRVPMLTLARQTGASGDYVIPAGLTLQIQAFEVARYAIQKMSLHRFAILAPRDRVGEDFTQHFWDAVEGLGGEITGIESYNPGETDFRQEVDKLSGLYYTEARQKELEELAKYREDNQIKRRTRKTEQFFSLKPIVDYDAVFVPDEPKIAGQILPTFAYRDVDNIQFLGPSAWNSPELVTRTQNAADNTLFVDAYFPESEAPVVRKFVEQYRQTFNLEPSAMEALAYDAARILDRALIEAGAGASRSDVLDKLKAIQNHPGVTGTISFKDGQYFRDLKVFTVRRGQIVDASSAAASNP